MSSSEAMEPVNHSCSDSAGPGGSCDEEGGDPGGETAGDHGGEAAGGLGRFPSVTRARGRGAGDRARHEPGWPARRRSSTVLSMDALDVAGAWLLTPRM